MFRNQGKKVDEWILGSQFQPVKHREFGGL